MPRYFYILSILLHCIYFYHENTLDLNEYFMTENSLKECVNHDAIVSVMYPIIDQMKETIWSQNHDIDDLRKQIREIKG